VKLSAIVGHRVSSHFYKFQIDRPYLCLTLVLNQIDSLFIRLTDEIPHFSKNVYLVLSLIYAPFEAEPNSLQNYINIFRSNKVSSTRELQMWSSLFLTIKLSLSLLTPSFYSSFHSKTIGVLPNLTPGR
jgi:hypothetical protein